MSSQLRWGFLGTGWIADVLAKDLALIGFEIAAVGSRAELSAKAFAGKHGIEKSFGNYEELCASPDVDVIYVATPHPFHVPHALLALQHGKHVLLEKPAALNQRQVKEILDAAKAANRFVMEAMWSRFLPAQVSLRAAIGEGEIGDVVMISAEYSENKLPVEAHERMWNKSLGGGALLDLGVYPLALINSFLGQAEEISAFASLTELGVDQRLVSILKFNNDVLAQLSTLITGAGASKASVIGTRGRIELDYPIYGQFDYTVFDLDRNELRRYHDSIVGTGRQLQVLAADEAIRDGNLEHSIMPWKDSLALAGMMDEMRSQVGVVYDQD